MSNEAERLLKGAEGLERSWEGSDNCTYGNECYEEHWDFVIEARGELKKVAAEFAASLRAHSQLTLVHREETFMGDDDPNEFTPLRARPQEPHELPNCADCGEEIDVHHMVEFVETVDSDWELLPLHFNCGVGIAKLSAPSGPQEPGDLISLIMQQLKKYGAGDVCNADGSGELDDVNPYDAAAISALHELLLKVRSL